MLVSIIGLFITVIAALVGVFLFIVIPAILLLTLVYCVIGGIGAALLGAK